MKIGMGISECFIWGICISEATPRRDPNERRKEKTKEGSTVLLCLG